MAKTKQFQRDSHKRKFSNEVARRNKTAKLRLLHDKVANQGRAQMTPAEQRELRKLEAWYDAKLKRQAKPSR